MKNRLKIYTTVLVILNIFLLGFHFYKSGQDIKS